MDAQNIKRQRSEMKQVITSEKRTGRRAAYDGEALAKIRPSSSKTFDKSTSRRFVGSPLADASALVLANTHTRGGVWLLNHQTAQEPPSCSAQLFSVGVRIHQLVCVSGIIHL